MRLLPIKDVLANFEQDLIKMTMSSREITPAAYCRSTNVIAISIFVTNEQLIVFGRLWH